MIVRDITSIEDMHRAEDLQREVWEIEDREILPALWMKASISIGHTLIGAFDGRELAGFAYAAVALKDGEVFHHSDMLAVRRAYRRSGVGVALKLAQRDRAIAVGVSRITWTFDPLRAGNALLNFVRLGAVGDHYLVDYYGETSSGLHRGIGTDRLWVSWHLHDAHVLERIAGKPDLSSMDAFEKATPLLGVAPDGRPTRSAQTIHGDVTVCVPTDIGAIMLSDGALARRWREESRKSSPLLSGTVIAPCGSECARAQANICCSGYEPTDSPSSDIRRFYGVSMCLMGTPGLAPVTFPSRQTSTPLTQTRSMPSASFAGSWNVDRSMTRLGSKSTRSAFIPAPMTPRSRIPRPAAGIDVIFLIASGSDNHFLSRTNSPRTRGNAPAARG